MVGCCNLHSRNVPVAKRPSSFIVAMICDEMLLWLMGFRCEIEEYGMWSTKNVFFDVVCRLSLLPLLHNIFLLHKQESTSKAANSRVAWGRVEVLACVFSVNVSHLRSIIMKHGDHKGMTELFFCLHKFGPC